MSSPRSPTSSLKGRFPFRLGTTSCILPADVLPNVEFLAPLVDDVELVLFEPERTSLADEEVLRKLDDCRRSRDLSYTVHLPLGLEMGSTEETVRRRSVETCLRLFELAGPLDPLAWIVHLEPARRGGGGGGGGPGWRAALDRSVGELLAAGPAPRSLCAETLDYPLEEVEELITRHDLAVCIDVGHLLVNGIPVTDCLARFGGRCRVVHLHGVRDGKDHRDISALDAATVSLMMDCLSTGSAGEKVLTLEVFGREDFESSIRVLRERV